MLCGMIPLGISLFQAEVIMKHNQHHFDITETNPAEDTADREIAGSCGARCLCDGCGSDCSWDAFHDGPHRCFRHRGGCSDI